MSLGQFFLYFEILTWSSIGTLLVCHVTGPSAFTFSAPSNELALCMAGP